MVLTEISRIPTLLGLINTSQKMIEVLEAQALRYPDLASDCADLITTEGELLANYRKELRRVHALLNSQN